MFQRQTLKEAFFSFWNRNPALYLGLSLLLGTAAHFRWHWLLPMFAILLSFTAQRNRAILAALVCFAGAYFQTAWRHPQTTLSQNPLQGTGIFRIEQVKMSSSPFQRSLLYKGTLHHFETKDGIIDHTFPCYLYLPLLGKRLPAHTDYKITGKLVQKDTHVFVLKPDKTLPWEPQPTFLNLSEWRFQLKQKVSHSLKKEISHSATRTFLTALATGDVDERLLSMEFGKVGLQHILAISGFHFALVACFLNFLFRLFLPGHISASFLILSLTFYYLFLGNAPSIQRAYIAITLIIIGQLFSLRISGLNALGMGLIVELLFEPLVVTHLSFQLTFLCTFAILLFYSIVHRVIQLLLPERSLAQRLALNSVDRHGYILSAFFRKALALNLAVHFISLPVILHLSHKFPLLSLAYNLFFPLCVSLSMLLLFSALLFAPLFPAFSHLLHLANDAWTSSLLSLTSNPPAFLDFSLRTKAISFTFVLCFLAASFFLGIFFYEKERKRALEHL